MGNLNKYQESMLLAKNAQKCAFKHSNDYRLIPKRAFIEKANIVHGNKYKIIIMLNIEKLQKK